MRNPLTIPCALLLALLLASCAPSTVIPVEPTQAPQQTTAPVTPPASPYPPGAYPGAAPAAPDPATNGNSPYPYPDTAQTAEIPLSPYPAATGDASNSGDEPWRPQPSDAGLEPGTAFVEEAQVLTLESMPPQFRLQISGNLPTPCHLLRLEIIPPDAQNLIQVRVYSVVKADMLCTQVLEPFNVSAPLEGLPAGSYTVQVNGTPAGSLDVP